MDLGLQDRSYIVTGGTSGLGFAVANVLCEEGARVVVSSRDPAHVDEAVERLGPGAVGLAADITEPSTPGRLIATAEEHFGALHGAFISHGGPPAGPATTLDDDALEQALQLATVGPVRLIREVAGAVNRGGAIAVLTSSSSVQPIAGLATSNVARPAVWGYVKTLADEVAPRGIRINVVLPGRFATERVDELDRDAAEREGVEPAEIRHRHERSIPLRRLGDPEELGRVAAFLLSPAAGYVTGAAWAVDGGVVRGL